MHYITNIPDDMLYSTYVHQQQERLLAEEKGRAEGRAEGRIDLIKNLLNVGRSIKEIADFFKTDESEINSLLENS
jgi:predicted transposase YdaD